MAGARILDPTAWAQKAVDRAVAAAQTWQDRAANPSKSPTAGMKKASAKYRNEVTASLTEGRWDKAIGKLTDGAISAAVLATSPQRYADGISTRKEKIQAAITKWHGILVPIVQQLDAMPIDTLDQRIAKAVAAIRAGVAGGKAYRA